MERAQSTASERASKAAFFLIALNFARPWKAASLAVRSLKRREFFLDRRAVERDVLGKAVFDRHLHLAQDERAGVSDQLFVGKEPVLGHPVAGDLVRDVGDVLEGLEVRDALIRAVGQADQFHHDTTLVLDGRAHRRYAAGGRLVDVGLAGEMAGGPLGVTQLHAAGLDLLEPGADETFYELAHS